MLVIPIVQSKGFFLTHTEWHTANKANEKLTPQCQVHCITSQNTKQYKAACFHNYSFWTMTAEESRLQAKDWKDCRGEQVRETQEGTKGFNCFIPFLLWPTLVGYRSIMQTMQLTQCLWCIDDIKNDQACSPDQSAHCGRDKWDFCFQTVYFSMLKRIHEEYLN